MKKVFANNFLISLLCLILGVAFVIWPDEILGTSAKVIAVIMLVASSINIILYAFSNNEKSSSDVFYILVSIIMIVLAISIFINPTWIITSISIIVGIVLIINSIGQITSVVSDRKYILGWGYFIIIPVLSIIAGFLLIINSSEVATFLMRITGISLIINTLSTWGIMYRLKKINDKIEKIVEETPVTGIEKVNEEKSEL